MRSAARILVGTMFIGGVSGCAVYVKMSQSLPSADDSLTLAVVDHIAPGQKQRKHNVFLGIGEKSDNPPVKYFKAERTYILADSLDWNVGWLSNERVTITMYECPGYKGLRKHPDPECRELEVLNLERAAPSEMFHVKPVDAGVQ